MDSKLHTERIALRQARVTLGLTLMEAARRVGSNKATLSYYESGGGGSHSTTMATLRAICRAYAEAARELGYDPAPFHESVLCPGDGFPAPVELTKPEVSGTGAVAGGNYR